MYEYKARVTASQASSDGRQTVISALNMMQDSSQLWMESEPEYTEHFKENGITQVIVSRQTDFLDLAKYGEKLVTKTSVFECTDCLGYRNTAIYREDGTICAISWSVGAFISVETGRMIRLPKHITDGLVHDPKLDMEYMDKRIKLPDEGFKDVSQVIIKPLYIDVNHHVNNVKYIEMACEFIPEEFDYSRIRVEYRKAAKLHDKVYISSSRLDQGKICVKLCCEEGKPYSIVEFSNPHIF